MTANPDYYAALGITPQATPEEVARAYRMMMRARHPDTRTSPMPGSAAVTGTAADVPGITDAYAVLRDPARRAAYDRQHQPPPGHNQREGGRNEGARFPPDGPPLIIGPVRWQQVQERTKPTLPGPVVQEPAPDGILGRPLPFLALILPTQTGAPTIRSDHDERKEP